MDQFYRLDFDVLLFLFATTLVAVRAPLRGVDVFHPRQYLRHARGERCPGCSR